MTLPVWASGATEWENALRIVDFAVYCSKGRRRGTWTRFNGVATGAAEPSAVPASLEDALQLHRIAPHE